MKISFAATVTDAFPASSEEGEASDGEVRPDGSFRIGVQYSN